MPQRTRFLLALTLLGACSQVDQVEAPAPDYLGAAGSNATTDALQVWLRGASYIEDASVEKSDAEIDAMSEEEEEEYWESVRYFSLREAPPFLGMDPYAAKFMDAPRLKSAVQFSCASSSNLPEERFVEALDSPDPLVRLQALVVLMHVRASRSIVKQWETLGELERTLRDPVAIALLANLRGAFSAESLKSFFQGENSDLREGKYEQQWALRAIGVAQVSELLPILRTFVLADHRDNSLAAQHSLTELQGPEADALLLECVLTWHYDAAQRAASELMERNPTLLEEGLLANAPPYAAICYHALYLGQLGNPVAVIGLCQTVGARAIVDHEMFDLIEELATEEHRVLIQELPTKVRDEQKERAFAVRSAVFARLAED